MDRETLCPWGGRRCQANKEPWLFSVVTLALKELSHNELGDIPGVPGWVPLRGDGLTVGRSWAWGLPLAEGRWIILGGNRQEF